MESELQSHAETRSWKLTDLPEGYRAARSMWVFDVKLDADGAVERYKARVVLDGSSQPANTYNEVFAPTAKGNTNRILYTLAAEGNWNIRGMDVVTAFLHGWGLIYATSSWYARRGRLSGCASH
jgi:hypothetical protein